MLLRESLSLKQKKEKKKHPGERVNTVPHYHKLCSQVSHIWAHCKVSISKVQQMSHTLERPPSCLWYLPCQASIEPRVFMKLKIMFTKPRLIKIFLILIYISSVLEIHKTLKYYSIIPQ